METVFKSFFSSCRADFPRNSSLNIEIENQRSKREVMTSDMGKIFKDVLRSLAVQH